jgi:serine/threonine protein kinase
MGYKKGDIFRTAFDTYAVEKQIGAGGSGEVYEVKDSDASRHAAKVLDAAKTSSARLKRFRNEIFFCSKNVHPNILLVQGSGVASDGSSFYVMPLYPNTLRDLITRGIAPEAVLGYFGQVLDGIEAAHLLGVWHRDFKPENVLHSSSGDSLVVADFGIAHFEEEELLTAVETRNNERLANFLYSAPEQRVRGQSVDSKADVYAVALVLNEMFTGAVPQGTNFRKISDVSPAHAYLDGLVDEMMRQDPAARPSVAEVKRQLIARGNDFLSLQRLNEEKSLIIPDSEVDDQFIRNPITLKDVDYQGGQFIFHLSAAPPRAWIMAFQDPRSGSWGGFPSAGPQYFSFAGDRAYLTAPSGAPPQQLVDYAKSYIDMANRQYAERISADHRKRLEEQRQQLRRSIQEEEHRRKVLHGIKI